jgi:hypothetical protein
MTMSGDARDVQVTLEPMLAERLDAVVAIDWATLWP